MKKQMFKWAEGNRFLVSIVLSFGATKLADRALNFTAFQNLLTSGETFDVVIVEQFTNDAFKVLGPYFGAPIVVLSAFPASLWTNHLVGNPTIPSYISDFAPRMTLLQRTYNTVFMIYNYVVVNQLQTVLQGEVVKKYFPDIEDWTACGKYNVSLVLLNSHASISQPVPLTPNMIEIGGFHVKPAERLPNDLQHYLDRAKEGVVYFSMGSNLNIKYLSDEKREAILDALSKLKYKVLWKLEDDTLPGKPSNVMVKKWFPQQSVLAHPNVKLFITHGGLLSTIETIYHGVPILAIPIYGDQEANAGKAVTDGYGVKLAYKDFNGDLFFDAIMEVLDNPSYAENAKTRSALMHDRPMKPLDTAIYWIEYVVRHRGTAHLRSAALDLAWYQYFLLDVMVLLLALTAAVIYLVRLFVRTVCCKKPQSEAAKNKKKKTKKAD